MLIEAVDDAVHLRRSLRREELGSIDGDEVVDDVRVKQSRIQQPVGRRNSEGGQKNIGVGRRRFPKRDPRCRRQSFGRDVRRSLRLITVSIEKPCIHLRRLGETGE